MISTKLDRPPLPRNALLRPRLVDAIDQPAAPFTVIVAGPGYGKTVAATQWAIATDAPVAWVSLGPADDRPSLFWRYVSAALERAAGVGTEALLMLDDEPDATQAVSVLLADLAAADGPIAVVLDDLHVIRSEAVLQGLGTFIEHLPPSVRVIATCRVDPQLPIGRWRASGQLGEVRLDDLKFRTDETAALFADRPGIDIEAEDVTFLTERTEGWAAGLQLAVLSLRDRADAHAYIHTSLAGDRGIVDYLIGEVLESLSSDDRDLVLALAILDTFDVDLAVAVTGRADAGVRMRSLESRHLFLLPVDDRGERYRYHQLLRELLVTELRWRNPDHLTDLHVTAARHLEAAGETHEAARHLIAAGREAEAFQLVIEPVWELLDRGNVAAARTWLALLPSELITDDVDRIRAYAVLLAAAGEVDRAGRWLARIEAQPTFDELTLPQQVQHYGLRAFVEYLQGDRALSQLSVLRCLDLLGDRPLSGPLLDRLGGLLVRHAIDDHRLDAAAHWLGAIDGRHESVVIRDLLPTTLAASLALAKGDLDEADRLSRHVIAYGEREQLGPVAPVGEARIVLAEVLLERCRFADAEEQAAIAAESMAERRFTLLESRARLLAVEAASARFGPSSGLQLLEATRRAFEHRQVGTDLRDDLDAAEARIHLLHDDPDRARRLIARLPADARTQLLQARADLLTNQLDQARATLAAIEEPTAPQAVEALVLLAQAQPSADALDTVLEAAALADASGRRFRFLREGTPVARLARRAHAGCPTPQLASLLAELAPERRPTRTADPGGYLEPLADRELTLLRLLPTHLTYREMGEEMCVSINTIKTYQKALFRKLNVSKRSEAVAAAQRAGLIDSPPVPVAH